MGEISNLSSSQGSTPQILAANAARNQLNRSASALNGADEVVPQDQLQLTRLSSVLNGLQQGASVMRSQLSKALTAVRSGSYEVDPLQVSRSIVSDCLGRAQ